MPAIAPYGSWDSRLTPDSFGRGNCAAVWELEPAGDGVFWTEQCLNSGMRQLFYWAEGREREEWAKGHSVHSGVHEYGGGSFHPTPEGGVIFSCSTGLYEQSSFSSEPRLLIDSNKNTKRFADFSITATHIICICEAHDPNSTQDPINSLVSIDRKTFEIQTIANSADFYASPKISPSGRLLVWIQWNHINMPWDETSIHLAEVQPDGSITNERKLRDGVGKNINYSFTAWNFGKEEELLFTHDSTNFWNVYRIDCLGNLENEENLHPIDEETGHALWFLGDHPFSANGSKIVLQVSDKLFLGEEIKGLFEFRELFIPGFQYFTHISLTTQGDVFCIASGPKKSSSAIKITPKGAKNEEDKVIVVREAQSEEDLADFDISQPEKLYFHSDGREVCGYFYPPKNSDFSAPSGSLPPVILYGHGGPTACAIPRLELRKQFFTTRGFALFDVDYRGSTGYGTEFRNLLKKQFGVYDRDDMINAAKMLIETGRVDPDKVAIMGQSSGGFLVLTSLVASDVFKAAVSWWGVADLASLSKITHKFERCYNEVLIGKYPEEADVYAERTPTNHIDRITSAVAFLHGGQDTVVPVSQSIELFEALRKRGRTTALQIYENEGHGFKGAEAVKKSNEAAYFFLCKAMGIEPSIQSDIEIVNAESGL